MSTNTTGHAHTATDAAAHHVLPLRTYFFVFGALLALTGTTTAIAYMDLGAANTPVALTIASIKVVIVMLWFMHLRYSSKLVQLFAAAGFAWLAVLFAFMLSDILTRGTIPGWE